MVTRVTKLEEQTKWMFDRMVAAEVAHGTIAFHGDKKMRVMTGKGRRNLVDSGESRRFEFTIKEKGFKRIEEND